MISLNKAFPTNGSNPLAHVALVVSDNEQALAVEYAQSHGIPTLTYRFQPRELFELTVSTALDAHEIDLVCLAGFMRILSPEFVAQYEGRILNIHPSLLPKYRGLDPQQRAIDAGDSESGCTVHYVDAGIDTGKIILQRTVPIEPGDTAATLAARILHEEHEAYPEAVRMVLKGQA